MYLYNIIYLIETYNFHLKLLDNVERNIPYKIP